MAYNKKYALVAIIGIVLASGAAWWSQRPPATSNPASANPANPNPAPAGSSASAGGVASGPAQRAPSVEVIRVQAVTLVDEVQAVGSLRSRQGVMVRPEVAGRVKAIAFTEGQRVKKGQLLVQLDDQLPAAQVAQAKAEMSIAQGNHKRNQDLVAQGFISQRTLDESAAALEVAQAKLQLALATQQRLRIVAPFDGVTGLKQVNVGDYLKDGVDIVNIEDMDAVLVDFRLPERFQNKIRLGQKAQLNVDALPGQPFTALVQAVDPLIDVNGRSVGIRGCIDNRQRQLRPGMFVRVNTVFGVREQALVVPEEALVPQGGRSFVVKVVPGDKPDSLVSKRVAVKTGLRQLGKVEITEGLQAGDTVVTAGHQRLQKDGTAVRVVDLAAAGKAASSPQAGASAPAPSGDKAGAASTAAASSAAASKAVPPQNAPAAPRALSGPNPCLQRG